MGWIAEQVLYGLARTFYRTEVAHSGTMKAATTNANAFRDFRSGEARRVLDAIGRYKIEISGRDVLDLGCNDGVLTSQYQALGPRSLIGVDIDAGAIERAKRTFGDSGVDFRLSGVDRLPLEDDSVDSILCFDVFEHVSRPAQILAECRRVLRPGGRMLIGTWGWKHPFAPHLWATMPVPWAHVVFGERTMLRTCRRVYQAPWYRPTLFDIDAKGQRRADRYQHEAISTDYLNKYLIRDFEQVFATSGMTYEMHLLPFGSKFARWSKVLLGIPFLREYLAGFLWAVLTKPASVSPARSA